MGCCSSRPRALRDEAALDGYHVIRPANANKMNSVSSSAQTTSDYHKIDPIVLRLPLEDALEQITNALESMSRCQVVYTRNHGENRDVFVYAVFTTLLCRFRDDLELLVEERDADSCVCQVRSASRLGYGDFGVNRARVEELRKRLAKSRPQQE
ncbi:MAG: hypothetical protein MHM6MM_000831 [Cercozoa sp. M6MM]